MHRLIITILMLLPLTIAATAGCMPTEEKISVAFVPSVESQTIIEQLAAFDANLSARIGTKVKSDVMPNYAACVEAMGTGQVDVAFLPPMAYVLGHSRYGIDVLLKVERKGKTVYRGEIIVRNDSGINTIEDLKGKKFAFVEASSASGHLYARALLKEHGIDVGDKKDSVLYTGSHPSVVQAVMQGTVDAGACYDDAREQAKDIAPGVMEETKVIAYTADIPADTVSIVRSMPVELRGKIAEALKEMATGKEGSLYAIYQIEYLHDATDADYEPLRQVGKTLGIDFAEYIDVKGIKRSNVVVDQTRTLNEIQKGMDNHLTLRQQIQNQGLLILVVIYAVIWGVVFGVMCHKVATRKGFRKPSDIRDFLGGFLLGVFYLLYLIALPAKVKERERLGKE